MSKKEVQAANFNIVFHEADGDEEAPLLKYFDRILMPALQSGIQKADRQTKYLFQNVQVIETCGGYALSGYMIKETMLEIRTILDEKGELCSKIENHPSAPFSVFLVFLKNHRMAYIRNQKGSPTLRNFSSAVQYVLHTYVREYNKKQKDRKLPEPSVHILGVPFHKNIWEALEGIDRINSVTLRFYPLNGDQEFASLFGDMLTSLRKTADSKHGEIKLRSPKSVQGVITILEQSEGTVEPVIEVTYPDKSKENIRQDAISQKQEIEFEDDDIGNMEEVAQKTYQLEKIRYTSTENERIYEENKHKIIPFAARRMITDETGR